MKRFEIVCAAVVLVCGAMTVGALTRDAFSPAAQALLPEGDLVEVTGVTGKVVRGILVSKSAEGVAIRIDRAGGITATRRIPRNKIKAIVPVDVAEILSPKLLELQLDPESSLDRETYESRLALFDELLRLAPGSSQANEVKALRDAHLQELANLDHQMEKIEGEWLPPVAAAIKHFTRYSEKIKELQEERHPREHEARVAEVLEDLTERRRAAARSLPKTMQERIPRLIEEGNFDEATEETTAFLHFWIDEVMQSEGRDVAVIREMDFDYILRMQERIMEGYRNRGLGKDAPRQRVAADEIYVPGGYFLMGREDAEPKDPEFPMHIVFVAPFVIDKYEVSNAEYRKFVEHVKASGDSTMEHPDAPPLKKHDAEGWQVAALSGDRQPVVGVDWFDAYAYAKWVGKRLPTEAEWEKAARGMDARSFPWGETPAGKCAINTIEGRRFLAAEMDRQNPPQPPPQPPERFGCGCVKKNEPPPPPPPTKLPSVTWDVDAVFPPLTLQAIELGLFKWDDTYESPYGALHMAGNASEWVQDIFAVDYYAVSPVRDPQGPEEGTMHVFRGGSYMSPPGAELTYQRAGNMLQKIRGRTGPALRAGKGDGKHPTVGIRCAKSLDISRN